MNLKDLSERNFSTSQQSACAQTRNGIRFILLEQNLSCHRGLSKMLAISKGEKDDVKRKVYPLLSRKS